MAEKKIINNISDYINIVCLYNRDICKEQFFHSYELLFRGQADKNYLLLPSLGRNRDSIVDISIFNEERNMIEMAKYKMPTVFRDNLQPIELLALLQHHGIPTRLLDVTENALVALYFACSEKDNVDGEVVIFKNNNSDVTNYPIVNAIADSYRFSSRGTYTSLTNFYEQIKDQPYFLEQKYVLKEVHKDKEDGAKWIKQCCDKIQYVYASTNSVRQQVQHGRYILFPNRIDDELGYSCFTWMLDEIPKDHPDIICRIIIPKEIKKEILEDLKVLGISKEFLFCDSIDSVCEGIVKDARKKIR